MFHAGITAAFGDGLVKRVVAGGSTEQRQIILAETADRIGRQRHFAHRVQVERAGLTGRTLACRIEGADAFQRIAEEIEAHGLLGAGHENIENTAADGKFADFAHGRDAVETVALQPRGDIVHADLIAGFCREGEAFDDLGRRDLLQHGVDRDEDDRRMRLLGIGDQARKSGQSPGGDIGTGRDAVIGKAVPAGQSQDRNFRRHEGEHLLDIGHALAVGHDIGDRLPRPRQLSQDQRLHARRHIADDQRRCGRCNLLGVEAGNHFVLPSFSASDSSVTGEKSGL